VGGLWVVTLEGRSVKRSVEELTKLHIGHKDLP
jgi:hypothetical protein